MGVKSVTGQEGSSVRVVSSAGRRGGGEERADRGEREERGKREIV